MKNAFKNRGIVRGKVIELSKENPNLSVIQANLEYDPTRNEEYNDNITYAALICEQETKLNAADPIVFFNKTNAYNNGITYTENGSNKANIRVALNSVPNDVDNITFIAYLNDGNDFSRRLSLLSELSLRLSNPQTDSQLLQTENFIPGLTNDESALVLGKLYRKNGSWRFKAIGQGYSQGITALLQAYGANNV